MLTGKNTRAPLPKPRVAGCAPVLAFPTVQRYVQPKLVGREGYGRKSADGGVPRCRGHRSRDPGDDRLRFWGLLMPFGTRFLTDSPSLGPRFDSGRARIGNMERELSDEESAALLRELDRIIQDDRYPLSPRMVILKAILNKIRPEPVREPLPPTAL